ncbi:MAG: hypothetical protein ACOCYE_14345 [Pseudomonadota bacterium]
MFGKNHRESVLRRYAAPVEEPETRNRYFVEQVKDGKRLAGGRGFPSIMAGFMVLASLACTQTEPLRIVDAEGKTVYLGKAAETDPASLYGTAMA